MHQDFLERLRVFFDGNVRYLIVDGSEDGDTPD